MSPPNTRNNSAPDCAQLAGMIGNLQTDVGKIMNGEFSVSGMSELVQSIKVNIIKELDGKLELVKSDYLTQLDNAKRELNIKFEADANATIRAVTGFFKQLDEKVTEQKVNMDIYEEACAKNKTNIEKLADDIEKWNESRKWSDEQSVETRTNEDEYPMDSDRLYELEKRLDSMEDQSRRDNLIFYNFEEKPNENCENVIKNFVCNRVLTNDPRAENIKIVRAHRLGKPEKDIIRPIIVKYREYSDKVNILQNSKSVEKLVTEPVKPGISEDFSLATKRDREFLKTCIASAKQHLGEKMNYGFLKYKSLVIKDCTGEYHSFHVNVIRSNPGSWLKRVERVEYS